MSHDCSDHVREAVFKLGESLIAEMLRIDPESHMVAATIVLQFHTAEGMVYTYSDAIPGCGTPSVVEIFDRVAAHARERSGAESLLEHPQGRA